GAAAQFVVAWFADVADEGDEVVVPGYGAVGAGGPAQSGGAPVGDRHHPDDGSVQGGAQGEVLAGGGVARQQVAPGRGVGGAHRAQVDAVVHRLLAPRQTRVPAVLGRFSDQDRQQVQCGAAELVADALGGAGAGGREG